MTDHSYETIVTYARTDSTIPCAPVPDDWPVGAKVTVTRTDTPAPGAARIAAERQRQIETEGWTPEHDDGHASEELARAAICYVAAANAIRSALLYAYVTGPLDAKHYEGKDRQHVLDTLEQIKADPLGYHYGRDDLGRVKPPSTAHWPWDDEWWNPSPDPITNLVKAGALIAAEIDRQERIDPEVSR